jgi:hypothetical protein
LHNQLGHFRHSLKEPETGDPERMNRNGDGNNERIGRCGRYDQRARFQTEFLSGRTSRVRWPDHKELNRFGPL